MTRAFLLAALFAVGLMGCAQAQIPGGGVSQIGAVTAGHCTSWVGPGLIQDSGGDCGGASGVSSISNSDGTLTISPTTGDVVASLNLSHANIFTAGQTMFGTSWPSFAAGDFIINGLAGTPTFAANGEGAFWVDSVNGASWMGDGSSFDNVMRNSAGSIVFENPHGNQDIQFLGTIKNTNNSLQINSGGIVNPSTGNNASISVPNNGPLITRNVADTNVALTVSQLNASSTGDILDLKNSGGTVAKVTQAGAGSFAGMTVSTITGSTQCLHVNTSGVVSGTGSDCGSASGLTVGTTTITSGTSGRLEYNNSNVLGELALGNNLAINSSTLNLTSPDNTKTISYTIAATDMGGQVNFNGSSLTVTIPAISSTVLAAGMSITITNINASALTISTTPTINGFNGTSIPQFGGINCVSNGASLDCIGLGVLANQAFTNVAQSYSAPQRTNTETPAISTSTFTPVFSTGQNHRIVLVHASCPCTLANPAALVAGQSGMFEIVQSATGSDTIGTWGSEYQYAGGTSTITLSTGANAVDYLPYYVDSTGSHIVLGGIIKGPAH